MTRMKALIAGMILTGVVFAASSTAFAQMQRMTTEERIAELKKAVTLTADQEKKVKEIFEAQAERRGGGQGGGPRGSGMMGMGMGMGNRDRAIEEVLTADQIKKLRAFRREQNITMRIEMVNRIVTLTDDQKTKLKAIFADEADKTEKMMGDASNASDDDRRAMFEKMRTLREDSDKAIVKVLTKEQAAAYTKAQEEFRQNMQERRRGNE